ncbi:hypothetical protein [Mycobacterium tilburgii]|uniref:hypothetical protein n=1 Tax=Mycobacterium tilburgii TaxID=44467 RepID=UPI00118407D2|nr:hypothetical protein [Mycobacterium tilburgii]
MSCTRPPIAAALARLAAGTLPPRDGHHLRRRRRQSRHARVPVLRELGLPAAVCLATGPIGSTETLRPDRLWLAIAHTTATRADRTALGLGIRPLAGGRDRATVYGAAVEEAGRRTAVLNQFLGALGYRDDVDAGPFRVIRRD